MPLKHTEYLNKLLATLKELGLKGLHVGVESGSDLVLEMCNKGETVDEMIGAFDKLDQAGIQYYVTSIIGLGGKTLWREHALETARLYSRIHPRSIWCLALKLWPNTVLYDQAVMGDFEPLDPREMLIEERLMLENINTTEWCHFMDTTVLNQYTIAGVLPDGKAALLKAIDDLLQLE